MDTCIVTGSTGFLGGYVTEALARSGWRVLALSRRRVESRVEGVEPVQATLEHLEPLRRAIGESGCDAAFHFGAALPAPPSGLSFERAAEINVTGTARLLDLLVPARPRVFVFASGINVYAPSPSALREDSAIAPADPYAFSKYCGEIACDALTISAGIRSVSLRISSPYGLGMNERTVLSLFVRVALAGEVPRYHGTGARRQNFVHAEDVARASLLALERGQGAYNVGGSSVSMRELAGMALEVSDRRANEAQASGTPDPQEGRVFELNGERAAAELGYRPQIDLEDGMRLLALARTRGEELVPWWREK